ncbi:bifunctional DNA-formamidopyrimidine glycosylase/DNA-(apurinic or apyrimidinic site) lyase [Aliikangiella coralliicola]|uniref:Formamidopyrimidine-DNA glycosylase n=1 Tax=Aliikangiella coralliicola TaxID=2592383 RepID=A0A545UHK8_9GAMM|nr:bifunctional DNA-formamidopyrimidine glycosylase/DNA-(apurinic or apyrimidinic site) lyase [Aliikangiella coralliicola]TQV88961.1 bifunctional DNA-formamidopyrimidine glycosylase/DNA-(apurinic or apyrimidinic site) lyase [Aliikangiella coralliicola]
MPELPEVETSCRGIEPFCVDQQITRIKVRQPKLRWPVDADLARKLKGKTILKVERRGKYMLLQTGRAALMIHLGMSGSLRIVESSVEAAKHDHIDVHLSNGKIIRYNDPRRFGSFIYNTEGNAHPLLNKLGVEPLSADFNSDYLYAVCQQRKVSIKTLIMNSNIVVGVGNIYAQESLFMSSINPKKAANKISRKRIESLVVAIKHVLAEAIKAGGSSLKDFTSAEGKPGYFQHAHQVYGRGGEACNQCGTTLKQIVISQRSTVYCGNCQR